MARSPIQSRKQDIKNTREVKVGSNGKIWGSLRNIGGARNPTPTITHKELFWEKDVLVV